MSEDEEYDLFCTHCGQRINKDTVFCPSCGTRVSDMGGEPTYGNGSDYIRPPEQMLASRLKVLAILFTVTAVYYVLSGLSDLLTIDSTIDVLKQFGLWDSTIDFISKTFSTDAQGAEEIFRIMTIVMSILYIVIGALIGVGAFCSFKMVKWKLGLVCLIVATVIATISGFGLIIGIIATYLYSTTKPCFQV